MRSRFGLEVLAYILPTFALGFVWYLGLFHSYYRNRDSIHGCAVDNGGTVDRACICIRPPESDGRGVRSFSRN